MNRVVFGLIVLAALRVAWLWGQPVSPEEASQWMCAARLAPAYFDGPGGTASLLAAMASAGWDPLAGGRILWPVLAFFAGLAFWALLRNTFSESTATIGLLGLNILPGFNLASVSIGPLMPAFFLVMAGVLFSRLAWMGNRSWWIPAGLAFGAAVLFRYEAVLIPAGLIVAVFSSPKRRASWDAGGAVWCGIALAAALWMPLAWNAALEWVPIAGGTLRTALEIDLLRTPQALAGGGTSWFGALVILTGLVILVRDARVHRRSRFLLASCGPVAVWWLYEALRGNSASFAALAAGALLAGFLCELLRPRLLVAGFFAGALASVWTVSDANLGRGDWRVLAETFRVAARDLPAGEGDSFFIVDDPAAASVIGFYFGSKPGEVYPPVFVPESPGFSSQFAIWPSYADFVETPAAPDEFFQEQKGVNPFIGRNALFLGRDLPQTIRGAFAEVTPLRTIRSGGREWTIFLCLDYQTLPL